MSDDTDGNGDALSLTSVSNAVNGTVSLDGSGNVIFTPDADFHGTAGFDYEIDDGWGGTDSGHVTVTVSFCGMMRRSTAPRSIALSDAGR